MNKNQCPACGATRSRCAECRTTYQLGSVAQCPREKCKAVDAPVDCVCGMVVASQSDGIITPEGDFRAFRHDALD